MGSRGPRMGWPRNGANFTHTFPSNSHHKNIREKKKQETHSKSRMQNIRMGCPDLPRRRRSSGISRVGMRICQGSVRHRFPHRFLPDENFPSEDRAESENSLQRIDMCIYLLISLGDEYRWERWACCEICMILWWGEELND